MSRLASLVGTHLLPFTNPRVVSPPGRVVSQGRPNLIVATPMRSGTHVLIDLILNNLPAYRNKPLYVDLDQCVKKSGSDRSFLADVRPDAGYVLKTHMPLETPASMLGDGRIQALMSQACVVTVFRERAEVCASLGRWHGLAPAEAEARFGQEYDRFWSKWERIPHIRIAFEDLFRPAQMQEFLDDLARRTNTRRASLFTPPPGPEQSKRIYANKTLTRLLGRRAPRIDTTIHTLKA